MSKFSAKFTSELERQMYSLAYQGVGIMAICEKVGISHEAHRKRMIEGKEDGEGEKYDYYRMWEVIEEGIGEGLTVVGRTQTIRSCEYDSDGRLTKEVTDVYTFGSVVPREVDSQVVEAESVDSEFDKIMEARRERMGLPNP